MEGPGSRYCVMLYIFRKALESQSQFFHVLECGCALCFCFPWKAGSGTSVMRNGAEYQTIVIDTCVLITFHSISGQCKC